LGDHWDGINDHQIPHRLIDWLPVHGAVGASPANVFRDILVVLCVLNSGEF
jgi:hypothetical protein